MRDKLVKLQKDIYEYSLHHHDEYYVGYSPKLSFFPVGELFDISFFGEGYDDYRDTKMLDVCLDDETNFAYCSLLDLLSDPKNSEHILSISFGGPDKGANGAKGWDFSRLINSNAIFSNLKSFAVQLTDLGDHNGSVIDGDCLAENGVLAKLVSKMPNLAKLTVPSAPDSSFFDIGDHPLSELKLQAGYNHQNFIDNLANSENFKRLHSLDYTDLINFHDVLDCDYTSFKSFKNLFNSKAFSSIRNLKLRHVNLSDEQLFELQRLNKVQFLNIKANAGRYVSHMMADRNPEC